MDQLLGELPDSYASKQQAQRYGLDLAFCYANPIPGEPHSRRRPLPRCVKPSAAQRVQPAPSADPRSRPLALPAVMPHGALVDYEPCVLASVLPGASLRDLFRHRGRHVMPGALLQQLAAEGPEARRARWQHVPPEVLARQPPWLV